MQSWQILDVGSIWLKEFACALGQLVPMACWEPSIRWMGAMETWTRLEANADSDLEIVRFPLQRGYARFPVSSLFPLGSKLVPMLARKVEAAESVLITTTPFYAPVAERWPGLIVYYQTDLTVAYAGVNPKVVRANDRRMCKVASAVCPNSKRIATYMMEEAGCAEAKITVVPNATRRSNLYAKCPSEPAGLPADVAHLQRPLAGVMGNLAANMDWEFLLGMVHLTPGFQWLFVGPTDMPVYDQAQRAARGELLSMRSRAAFIGRRDYSQLQSYARAFDVAVLPYRKQEPTYSGSSTRFYEHLAACRPMIATRGFAELLEKEPLLKLVDTAEQGAEHLEQLRGAGFRDGFEAARWSASLQGTWEKRAEAVVEALCSRVGNGMNGGVEGPHSVSAGCSQRP